MARAGQDISRAIEAGLTKEDRIGKQLGELAVEKGQLENQLLKAQVRHAQNPPLPSNSQLGGLSGQGNSYLVEEPTRKAHSSVGAPERQFGAVTDYGFARTRKGLAIVPSEKIKERIEDQMVPELMWALRNQVVPLFKAPRKPSLKEFPLPKGYDWEWFRRYQEFRPVKK